MTRTTLQRAALFLLLVVAGTISACSKHDIRKIAGLNWNPELATPIGFAEFDVYDVLAARDSSHLLVIDMDNGEIALVYNSQLASFQASEVLHMPDYTGSFSYSAAEFGIPPTTSFSSTVSGSVEDEVDFPIVDGVELNTVNFADGNLVINVQTTLKHNLSMVLTFPTLKEGGVPVQRAVSLVYNGTVPHSATAYIDLSGLAADFTEGGTTVNAFTVQSAITIHGSGESISGSETLDVDVAFEDLKYQDITGYFGQQTLAAAMDTITLELFNKNLANGTFQLTNPSLKFVVSNSFGMPINLHFNELKTVNINDGSEFPLTGFPSDLLLNAPSVMGQTATTTLLLNTGNTTNLNNIISPTPKYLVYDVGATSNPAGNTGTLNFVEADSKFVINGELTLPLEGYAYGLLFTDTLPFDFTQNVNQVESALFRMNVANSFPVNFKAQAVFTDENYNPLFTLLDPNEQLMSAAPVDANGKVTASTSKITDVFLSREDILLMDQAKHIIILGGVSTTDPQGTIVKFFDSYKLSLKVGMQVKFNSTL